MFGFFVFISLMRGAGDTVTPMFVMLGTVILNVALDPFLINGWTLVANAPLVGTITFPELGIEGAAIATVFSRIVAMGVGLAIMLSGSRGIQIHLQDMVPNTDYLRKILAIGAPASAEVTGRALSINALLIVVGLFATPVVAAFGIGTRVLSVIFLPAIAIAQGVETMTGQNIGAGKPDRAEQANYVAAKGLFVILGFAGLLIFLVPTPIVAVFTSDPAVLTEGSTFLRFVALSFGFMGIMRAFSGGFRGAGKTLISATIAVGMFGVFRLTFAWIASRGVLPTDVWFFGAPDPRGIWLAFLVSNVVGAGVAWAWFRTGTWRDGNVRGMPGGSDDRDDQDDPDPTGDGVGPDDDVDAPVVND
jgi:putative MATE family efflux protein